MMRSADLRCACALGVALLALSLFWIAVHA